MAWPRLSPLLLLPVAINAWGQSSAEAAVAVADAIDKGSADLLTGILGGGGGASGVVALVALAIAKGWITVPRPPAPPPTNDLMQLGEDVAELQLAVFGNEKAGASGLVALVKSANVKLDLLLSRDPSSGNGHG